jgi:hypothetical protein
VPRIGQIVLVLCLATAPLSAARTPTNKVLIDGMAAKISGQIITVREARFFLALQRFREGKTDVFGPEGQGELRGSVQRYLLEEMVYSELKSLKFDGGMRAAAEKALAARKSPTGRKVWDRLLKTYGKTDAEAVDRVWKSQQVEKFIQRRVETMTPIVTSAEIDRFIRQKAASADRRVDEKDLEKQRPQAAQELKKDLMRKELEEWIVLLKRKYSVTNYLEG